MSFLSRFFGGSSGSGGGTATQGPSAPPPAGGPPRTGGTATTQSLEEIEKAIDTLNRREEVILKKVDAEVEQAMKRKKRYQDQLEVISAQRGNLETVQITLEEQALNAAVARATVQATHAMRTGNAQMEPDRIQKIQDDLREQLESHNDVVSILKEGMDVNPVDMDDLEEELMAELEKDKPKQRAPAAAASATAAPATRQKTAAELAAEAELAKLMVPSTAPKKTKQQEEEEALKALEAELA
jgi:charged multivesicular body protein 4